MTPEDAVAKFRKVMRGCEVSGGYELKEEDKERIESIMSIVRYVLIENGYKRLIEEMELVRFLEKS